MLTITRYLLGLRTKIAKVMFMKARPTIVLSASERSATELRRSITRLARLLGASMPKGELSPAKLSALGILRRDGPMTASALSSRLGIRPQSLTRILADVESAELLIRTRDPRDTREHILAVTPKAVSLMRDEGVRRDKLMRQTMQRVLTPVEIELLLLSAKLLNKLADGWSSADAETAAS
jgi:DNA-binding MarR family transcriptional regulator